MASGSTDATVIIWDVKNGNYTMMRLLSRCINGIINGIYCSLLLFYFLFCLYFSSLCYPRQGRGPRERFNSFDLLGWYMSGARYVQSMRNRLRERLGIFLGLTRIRTLRYHPGGVRLLAFSPDGSILASGSCDWDKNKTVMIWDVKNGNRIRTLGCSFQFLPTHFAGLFSSVHSDAVNALAFSPDGSILASGSKDNTVMIWDTKNGSYWLRALVKQS
uniref:Anaphase-promoting complex subunit 4 WD40 domain-containing protein n=1 Tax=Aureoumbra lagunensis TaxID=44058 RepID=A0A7S3JZ99_9STRA